MSKNAQRKKTVANMGRKAFMQGRPLKANPFKEKWHQTWRAGWLEARDEREGLEPKVLRHVKGAGVWKSVLKKLGMAA